MNLRQNRNRMLKEFFVLLTAVALQQLLALTVNLVDNFMLGSYSEQAMSGAALANQLQYMLQMLTGGIGAGVSVLGSQYWGKQEINPIKEIISLGLKFSVAAGVLFTVLTLLFPAQIIGLLTDDTQIIASSVEYLSVMSWTFVIYSVSSVLLFSLRSVQTAFIGMVMSGCTILINGALNYVLIYGNFGAPELGIRGAAYATLTSRLVELATILIYILRVDRKLRLKVKDLLSFRKTYLRIYFQVSFPPMVTGMLWGVAQTAQTAILGHISAEAIAANSIAAVIFQLFTCFGFSCANAASVVIGKTVGRGEYDLIRPYSRTLQLVFAGFGAVTGSLIFLCRKWIVGLYAVTPETRALSISFLTILSITVVGSCYEYPVESGIIAGGGDTKFAAYMDNGFMWLYTIPFAYLSAFVFEWSPVVTYAILKSDQILKCLPNGLRCNRYKWLRDWTRQSGE